MRDYKKQFETAAVEQITSMITDLGALGAPPTKYKLYTQEISSALSVGLLLSSVIVASAFLKLFVRDLLSVHRVLTKYSGDMSRLGSAEYEIEQNRQLGFSAMLAEIVGAVITQSDADKMLLFYDRTRIPFAHGLAQRLTEKGALSFHKDLAPLGRQIDLEDRLEDQALTEVSFVIDNIKRYRPWLVRRYESVNRDE